MNETTAFTSLILGGIDFANVNMSGNGAYVNVQIDGNGLVAGRRLIPNYTAQPNFVVSNWLTFIDGPNSP